MKIKPRLFYLFSLISFFAINLLPNNTNIILNVLLSAIIIFVFMNSSIDDRINLNILSAENISSSFLSACFSAVLGIRFMFGWRHSKKLLRICFSKYTLKNIVLCGSVCVLTIGAFFIFQKFFLLLKKYLEKSNDFEDSAFKEKKLSIKAILIILITSVLCITICSTSSPLYPFNDWSDVNVFFTIGKSALYGKVVFKDLYDHKGPLLYWVYSVAYLISPTSFFGVYLFEIINCFLFLLVAYKLLLLFSDENIIYVFPIMAVVIYTSIAFSKGGGVPEQRCLPCLALCYYFGMKALLFNKKISLFNWFIIGITSGAVLWIKFSLLGFYIGFGLYAIIFYIKNKWYKDLFYSILYLTFGVAVITLPVVLYFAHNNATAHLFRVYFYDNLFAYSSYNTGNKVVGVWQNLKDGGISFYKNYIWGSIAIALGSIYLICKKPSIFFFNVFVIVFSFLLIYSGGRFYKYYSFILSVFVPMGFVLIYEIVNKLKFKNKFAFFNMKKKSIFLTWLFTYFFLCSASMCYFGKNNYMLKYKNEDVPQIQFSEIISETDNPTLLVYGFIDNGFYTASNIVPNCKYFYKPNLKQEEIDSIQSQYIENGLIDYIVTNQQLKEEQVKLYDFIAEKTYDNQKGVSCTYYLYKKK